MFMFLRIIRGFCGAVAVWQIIGLLPLIKWLQHPDLMTGNIIIIAGLKLLLCLVAFGAFYGLGLGIHKLHKRKNGTDHPALKSTFSL